MVARMGDKWLGLSEGEETAGVSSSEETVLADVSSLVRFQTRSNPVLCRLSSRNCRTRFRKVLVSQAVVGAMAAGVREEAVSATLCPGTLEGKESLIRNDLLRRKLRSHGGGGFEGVMEISVIAVTLPKEAKGLHSAHVKCTWVPQAVTKVSCEEEATCLTHCPSVVGFSAPPGTVHKQHSGTRLFCRKNSHLRGSVGYL